MESLTPVCGRSPPTTLNHEAESYVESSGAVADMRSDADVETPPRVRSASYTSFGPRSTVRRSGTKGLLLVNTLHRMHRAVIEEKKKTKTLRRLGITL